MKLDAMNMIEEVFDPAHYQKLSQFFSKRNSELLDGIKADSKMLELSMTDCKRHAEQALTLSVKERLAYETRKGQLRHEFEHLTKVYKQTVAPFQMLMSHHQH